MRKVGAFPAIAALAAIFLSSQPAAAFGLRIGPFHLGLPFGIHHRHHLYMRAPPANYARGNPNDVARPERPEGPAPQTTSALFYPSVALPAMFDKIFAPASASVWPFDYDQIFSTAFTRVAASGNQRLCQPTVDANAMIGRIRAEVDPTPDQMQLLQKLGGAMGAASGFLAKACPDNIPTQPVARLQLMESQIEELAMAVDIIHQPLQDFEQSLNKNQLAKLASAGRARERAVAQSCGNSPAAIDWSINQIDQSVQPTTAQRNELSSVRSAFGKAVEDLQAHCPTALPPTALGRLEAIGARLDATWRATLAIQVALANFETKLSDEQKSRFDQMNLAAR